MTSGSSLPPNHITSPELLEKQGYLDLTGKINRTEDKFPAHTGGYSDVYTGYLVADPSYKVAIKVFRTTDKPDDIEKIRRWLNREAIVWHKLKHENVLIFLGLAPDLGRLEACPALISPYCTNGTVGDYIRISNPPVETRVSLVREILGVARGLEYLHEQNVIHGDLKPSNVLMSDKNVPLVCDFGRSLVLDMRGFTTKPAGTARYLAPELVEGLVTPNKQTDVCAFALTAFEIWTGSPPFSEILSDTAVIVCIIKGNMLQLPSPSPAFADRLWPILSPCFSTTPENRPVIQELVQKLETYVQ
ncbi:hypothetical protein D9756_002941 [Leucocoprinus leucothites]|uniref:Protein kinase domain-containing protein n=1 Tax=Leucocoprinus leucothites TaxID=201217 RepID=A0A8H5LJR5_9AGAR|nr:hypothetical protein D9756_002941 [Leucoagaricus leucothites]